MHGFILFGVCSTIYYPIRAISPWKLTVATHVLPKNTGKRPTGSQIRRHNCLDTSSPYRVLHWWAKAIDKQEVKHTPIERFQKTGGL